MTPEPRPGRIVRLLKDKGFGFIQSEGSDYFFHRDSFEGHWDDLIEDFQKIGYIDVTFYETPSKKGLRAGEVKRVDFPNQSV